MGMVSRAETRERSELGGTMKSGGFEELTVGTEAARSYTSGAVDSAPGVVVFHPWWGLNDDVIAYADRLAAAGFAVTAPDLVRGRTAATIEDAEKLASSLDHDHAEATALAAVDRLAGSTAAGLGTLGFSMGGPWAMWCATRRPAVTASVVYYAASYGPSLARAAVPVLGHFAEVDPYEPEEAVQTFERMLRDAGRDVVIHRYAGTGHWFAEPSRDAWAPEAAELAFRRTVKFLREQLEPGRRASDQ
jgi:carboxymethylenebutenolidase